MKRDTGDNENGQFKPLARALPQSSVNFELEVKLAIDQLICLESIESDPLILNLLKKLAADEVVCLEDTPSHLKNYFDALIEHLPQRQLGLVDNESPIIAAKAVAALARALRHWRKNRQFEAAMTFAQAQYDIGRAESTSKFFSRYGDRLDPIKTRNSVLRAAQRRRAKKGRWEKNEAYQHQKMRAKAIHDQWRSGEMRFQSLQAWAMFVLQQDPSIRNLETVLAWERYEWRTKPLPHPRKSQRK